MPLRRLSLVVAASLAVVTASACTAGSGAGGTPSAGSDGPRGLAVGLVLEPASLDFTKADGAAIPQALLTNVYEGLVTMGQDGSIQPKLATSWTVSPDRLTYTFTLVDSAVFSTGQPFTADDAVASINAVKSEWTTALAKGMAVVADAKATAPHTLQVQLSRPSNDWLFRMTTRIGAMFPRGGTANLATGTVGTGPYQLDTWKRGDALTLKRNPGYWGAKPYFDAVTFKYFKDPTALNNALLTGTINVIGTVQAPDSLGQFTADPRFQVIEGSTTGEVVLAMNNAKAPFNDVRVRQAARHAIDHKALLDSCWAGRGQLIGSMVPPTDPWYEDLTGLVPFDRNKAKAMLADAAPASRAVRLRVPGAPYATSCGQVVKSMLDQVGFTVTMDQLEFPTWLKSVFKDSDYELSIVAHVEPRDLGTVFGNPDYYLHYRHKALTDALSAADTGTPEQQRAQMRTAARIIAQDSASDWLFLLPNLMVADKGLTGLPKNQVSESFDLTQLARG